jgi:hypothetical protein
MVVVLWQVVVSNCFFAILLAANEGLSTRR